MTGIGLLIIPNATNRVDTGKPSKYAVCTILREDNYINGTDKNQPD